MESCWFRKVAGPCHRQLLHVEFANRYLVGYYQGEKSKGRRNGMSYKNTFIKISEDSEVTTAITPLPRNNKPTIASIEYDLISNNPYKYTQEDVQFQTYLIKNQIISDQLNELREDFFKKTKACFRASPLVKKYGWGIHYNDEGKLAIFAANSEAYNQFLDSDQCTLVKGMRSKRK